MEKRADVKAGQTPPETPEQPATQLEENTSKRLSAKWVSIQPIKKQASHKK